MTTVLRDPVSEENTDMTSLCLVSAERTLETEIAGLSAVRAALKNGLAIPFQKTFDLIQKSKGRVVITGIGKSGHIGTKIAASLASTGTPSFFVHASEASHGDLGMITSQDVVLAISNSGNTGEVLTILPLLKRMGAGNHFQRPSPGQAIPWHRQQHTAAETR